MFEAFITIITAMFIGFCIGYNVAKHNDRLPNKIAKKKKVDINASKYKKRLLKKILENRKRKFKKKSNKEK